MDKQTGVNYVYFQNGYGGGLTPLLDSEGKVVVTPVNGSNQNIDFYK